MGNIVNRAVLAQLTTVFLRQELSQQLTRSPDTLEDLKSVLIVISDIRNMSLTVEMKYRLVNGHYRMSHCLCNFYPFKSLLGI